MQLQLPLLQLLLCCLQMFVIKNLDTGLEMRIDDFDRLAHIAADPDPANQVSSTAAAAAAMSASQSTVHICAVQQCSSTL